MSSAVLGQPAPAAPGTARTAVRFLANRPDLVVLPLALPVFLATGLPLLAYAVVAVLWILQVVGQVMIDSQVDRTTDPRRKLVMLAGGSLARAWAVATVLLVLGLNDKDAGLVAVVFTAVLFTFYFAAKVFGRMLNNVDQIGGDV